MTFHSVGNFIIPTDFHSIIFQRGRAQPTRHGDFRSKLGFKPPFFSIDGSWRGVNGQWKGLTQQNMEVCEQQ